MYKRSERYHCPDSRFEMMVKNVDLCAFLALIVAGHVAGREVCVEKTCPGPVKYYKALGCTAVYKNPEDCCAMKYDCSHLDKLSKDKCYVNGHEYNVGDELKDEDRNPCDIGCKCLSNPDHGASFSCASISCPPANLDSMSNCFLKFDINKCCPDEVCLKEGEKRATCEVDGVTYKEGETFYPKSDQGLTCMCQQGYEGKNVPPFCRKPNHDNCAPIFYNKQTIVHDKCVPVFYDNQNPEDGCSYASRCPNANDTVIHNHDSAKSFSPEEESNMCQFGDMKMHIGDELNEGTSHDSTNVRCVCELPPYPTCIRRTTM